jgi:hypothetical protein
MKFGDAPSATGEIADASANRDVERNAELPRTGIAGSHDSELVVEDKKRFMRDGEQGVQYV